MRLRVIPRTAERLREEPKPTPDEFVVRSYRANVGLRYVVEARREGRCLGDRDFANHSEALAFAKLESGWHGARLVDTARG